MSEKTINDVYEAVLETNTKVQVLITNYEHFEKWREQHDKDDKTEHAELHKRISNTRLWGNGLSVITFLFGIFTGIKTK